MGVSKPPIFEAAEKRHAMSNNNSAGLKAISPDGYDVIVGGGPVGCYLAYQLLMTDPNRHVVLFESKQFTRPQVIRIPFVIAKDLPLCVKNKMWCDTNTRSRIFDSGQSIDKNFWPKPNYSFWPWISIGAFQEALIYFLKSDATYKDRFYFIPDNGNLGKNTWQEAIEKAYPHFNASIYQSIRTLSCTCGIYAKTLRQELNLSQGKAPEIKGHGIYLIYKNEVTEHYSRDENPLSYIELAANGISYAASNNASGDVQLYTYPEGDLTDIFQEIPDEFIQRASYNQHNLALTMSGDGLSNDAKKWFASYKDQILKAVEKFKISLPTNLNDIQVFYAQRTEYYWDVVATKTSLQEYSRPLFFLGDSAGSTDYKSGLSMGRGLLSVQALSQLILHYSDDFTKIITNFQERWATILQREFNKGSQLSSEPWIQYHYLIKGRCVIFPNATTVHYLNDSQYSHYMAEYQSSLPGFYRTSEASAVLFINTRALEENIKNIIYFAKCLVNSKIIAVVKSDGYGLGVEWVTEAAIKAGVNFLAVAKLEEAVAVRNSGIPGAELIRIMVFEAPLRQDIATFVLNRIEMVLPSDDKGHSVNILAESLKNGAFLAVAPLKVHIMVDTGMRRDSGHADSIPASILTTLQALQRLDKDQVEFAGLATHLACYRCTDYQGEEVVDYRALQLQRFFQVIAYLLLHKVHLPAIQIGGGLALLAEQWPAQFESLTKEQGIEFYTRIGHGLYGMELKNDLSAHCPLLRPVAELNFQVRNVFFVEENEPVSYGGFWRAPMGGVWIGTLSGGWADGIPRTVQTLGQSETGMMVSINHQLYPVVGSINMNAMMVNLGSKTTVQTGDRVIAFGWRAHEPKLNDLAEISGQIGPSITVNIPTRLPRIKVSDPDDKQE